MRKLLVCLGLGLAFMAAPAGAAVNLGLPPETDVNFDGNGVFSQAPIPGFEVIVDPVSGNPYLYPKVSTVGTELFGTGTISGVATVANPGLAIWTPGMVGPNFEMTFVFWDAVTTSSVRNIIDIDADGVGEAIISGGYQDGARLMLVQDTSGDFSSAAGPGSFDLVDGEYATAYTLEDAGYDSVGAPDAGSMFNVADDAGEEVFLDLYLSHNTSSLTWDPNKVGGAGFINGTFNSLSVEILGGTGAGQFTDLLGPDGAAAALILTFSPTGWTFGGDVDIQLTTVPEPATLVFLGTGLVSLLGYGIRRKMS